MSENPEELPIQSDPNMISIQMPMGILEITTDEILTFEAAIFMIEVAKIKIMKLAGILTQTNNS